MKLTINPKEIAPSLKRIERVIASKNLIAILDNFLLQVDGGHMKVTGSDNEAMVSIDLPIVASDEQFSFCVNAKKFSQAINSINADSVSIELDNNGTMICKHKKGKFNLSYMDGADYPKINVDETEKVSMFVNANVVRSLLNNVSYAVGNDALHPTLTGVYFDFTQDGMYGVASDTRKLVKNTCGNGDYSQMQSFIMPIKAATLVMPFLEQTNENDVCIETNGNVAQIKQENWSIIFRLINGRFPNYNAVIPKDMDNKATVVKNDFIESLQRALLFSQSQTNAIKLHFTMNKIELVAQDIDYNMSSTEEIECEYLGADITIGFNGAALASVVGNLDCEQFVLGLQDPSRAALLHPKDNTDVVAIIMPMMV